MKPNTTSSARPKTNILGMVFTDPPLRPSGTAR
jgi:hypothetical protein